jgi:colicin import membrane protein
MMKDSRYRKAFYMAISLHLFLALMLLLDPESQRPAVAMAKNEPNRTLPRESIEPVKEIVKAVNIDNQDVMKAVNRLKQERENQRKAEQARQQQLVKQAEMARLTRLQEQQRLAKLKEEAETIAIARKKQLEEEQMRLKQLAFAKEQETKRLQELKAKQNELKKKQQKETEKLEALKRKQVEEMLKAEKEQAEKAKAQLAQREKEKAEKAREEAAREKANAELAEKRRQAAAQQAAEEAKKAHIATEVDKYKALIVNAISRQWILPENVNNGLSSQFRIRLAPDGAVLEVTLTRSSGDAILDRSAQTAIYKASPLPVPSDSETFDIFRDISLTVRPENVRG